MMKCIGKMNPGPPSHEDPLPFPIKRSFINASLFMPDRMTPVTGLPPLLFCFSLISEVLRLLHHGRPIGAFEQTHLLANKYSIMSCQSTLLQFHMIYKVLLWDDQATVLDDTVDLYIQRSLYQ